MAHLWWRERPHIVFRGWKLLLIKVFCGGRLGNSGGVNMRLLLIPPNDLLRHPIPNRMFHIAKRLAKRHEIYPQVMAYTSFANSPRLFKEEILLSLMRGVSKKLN